MFKNVLHELFLTGILGGGGNSEGNSRKIQDLLVYQDDVHKTCSVMRSNVIGLEAMYCIGLNKMRSDIFHLGLYFARLVATGKKILIEGKGTLLLVGC
jgi:hypothetical protein